MRHFDKISILPTQDNEVNMDWGHWVFSESSVSTDVGLGCGCLPVHEGSVNSLHFDTFLNASSFTRISSYQNKTTPDQCSFPQIEVCSSPLDWPKCSYPMLFSLLADKKVMHCVQQKDSKASLKGTEGILAAPVEVILVNLHFWYFIHYLRTCIPPSGNFFFFFWEKCLVAISSVWGLKFPGEKNLFVYWFFKRTFQD